MTTFNHRGFDVTITKHDEGYLYLADNGHQQIAGPNPGGRDGRYPTEEQAAAAARRDIVVFDIAAMLADLSDLERELAAYIIKQLHERHGIADSRPDFTLLVLQAGMLAETYRHAPAK